ncbi:MAG: peptide deformylase, partial [Candidatus Yanofskybacteria bacterium RIFCSPLOWO2_02_FULL_41_13]
MADIIKIPNKILSNKTELAKVKDIKDGSFKELILEMRRSMKDHQGIGLAANQIGKNISIFVIEPILAQESGIQDVYINPEITEYSKDEDEVEEGCLSIPEYYIPTRRSKKIKIKFIDESGEKKKLRVRGFAARVLQHETDHLNGTVI